MALAARWADLAGGSESAEPGDSVFSEPNKQARGDTTQQPEPAQAAKGVAEEGGDDEPPLPARAEEEEVATDCPEGHQPVDHHPAEQLELCQAAQGLAEAACEDEPPATPPAAAEEAEARSDQPTCDHTAEQPEPDQAAKEGGEEEMATDSPEGHQPADHHSAEQLEPSQAAQGKAEEEDTAPAGMEAAEAAAAATVTKVANTPEAGGNGEPLPAAVQPAEAAEEPAAAAEESEAADRPASQPGSSQPMNDPPAQQPPSVMPEGVVEEGANSEPPLVVVNPAGAEEPAPAVEGAEAADCPMDDLPAEQPPSAVLPAGTEEGVVEEGGNTQQPLVVVHSTGAEEPGRQGAEAADCPMDDLPAEQPPSAVLLAGTEEGVVEEGGNTQPPLVVVNSTGTEEPAPAVEGAEAADCPMDDLPVLPAGTEEGVAEEGGNSEPPLGAVNQTGTEEPAAAAEGAEVADCTASQHQAEQPPSAVLPEGVVEEGDSNELPLAAVAPAGAEEGVVEEADNNERPLAAVAPAGAEEEPAAAAEEAEAANPAVSQDPAEQLPPAVLPAGAEENEPAAQHVEREDLHQEAVEDAPANQPAASAEQEAIEEDPRSAPGKDAIEEEPAKPAEPTEERTLILLLLADAAGSHDPQVFRMRSDQPLQRLLATYAKYRQLDSEEGLWLSHSDKAEKLDTALTAGSLGLVDADHIVVHFPEEAQPAATRKRAQPEPQQRRQRARKEPPAQETKVEQQPKRPPTAYFQWFSENRPAIVAEVGPVPVSAVAKAAGEKWKAMSAEDKAPFEAKVAEMRAEYERAMADFRARGGVPTRKGGAKRGEAVAQEQQLKRPTGGAYGEFLREQREEVRRSLPVETPAGEISREVERRWKDLSDDMKRDYNERAKQKMAAYKAAKQAEKQAADPKKPARAEPADIPASPVGLMRSARVTSGPACGWTVSAWRNTSKAICWKILEPQMAGGSSRTFRDFRELRTCVEKDVFKQLDQVVKPGLLKRLNDKSLVSTSRPAAGDVETPKRTASAAGEPAAKRSRGDGETPDRLQRPILATQVCKPPAALRPKGEAWTCGCAAHLRRHPRCTPGNDKAQPQLVHLKTCTTFGRAEASDVVLSSERTPQMLSRCHAVLECDGNQFMLTDRGSVNGCLVNSRSVHGKCMLRSGDVITFGVQTHTPEFDYIFETRLAQ